MKYNPGQAAPPALSLSFICCACRLFVVAVVGHTLSLEPSIKRVLGGERGGAGKELEIKERKRVQLTADIFLCAQAALMQIVEIFSTDQQLSDPPFCPTNPNPIHFPRTTEPTTHRTVEPSYLSCCCDWFCLMELERGNNFIELDFNVRQKARYFLISFSLLQLPLSPLTPFSLLACAQFVGH